VTASLLATDSPVLPHKMNGGYINPPQVKQNGKTPPAVPARLINPSHGIFWEYTVA